MLWFCILYSSMQFLLASESTLKVPVLNSCHTKGLPTPNTTGQEDKLNAWSSENYVTKTPQFSVAGFFVVKLATKISSTHKIHVYYCSHRG